MAKRNARTLRAFLWVCALILCCFAGVGLFKAIQPKPEIAAHSIPGEPATTGSLRSLRWCGAAWWCR